MKIKAGDRFYHAGDASMGRSDVWTVERDAKEGEFATLVYCGDDKLPDGHKWRYVDVIVCHDCLQELEVSIAGRARVVPGGIYHRELQVTQMWIGGNLHDVRHAGTVVMDIGDIYENSERMYVDGRNTLGYQILARNEKPTNLDNALIHDATEWAKRGWTTPELGAYLSWMAMHDDVE